MPEPMMPVYPVYVPSKGRAESGLTMKCLIKDKVPFFLVVEEQEREEYETRYPEATILVLPFRNQGLIAVRNWCKQHSRDAGAERHWQLDDNMANFRRQFKGKRVRCLAGIALRMCEIMTDRYSNVALSGLNYSTFARPEVPPYYVNTKVYSCSLILNSTPNRWEQRYNDDTDMCLQLLADGWCTLLLNAFMVEKKATMTVKGGNTDDLYQGDGRLEMARSLEQQWPYIVETKRRFNRPQHVIRNAWRHFDTQLKRREDIDWKALEDGGSNEFGMSLKQVGKVKTQGVKDLLDRAGVEIENE